MLLYRRLVDQRIDAHHRARFIKELLVTNGQVALGIVRKRLESLEKTRAKAAVLLVHGFGQNRYAWHLPSRSMVNHLAASGFDVYNLDLRGHGRSRGFGAPSCGGVAEYVEDDLPSAVAEVRAHAGDVPLFLVGHSLGGLVTHAAAAAMKEAPAGVISIASPYRFTRGSMTLTALAYLFAAAHAAGVPIPGVDVPMRVIGSVIRHARPFIESAAYPLPWRGWHRGALEAEVLDDHLRLAFDRASITEMANMFLWSRQRKSHRDLTDHREGLVAWSGPLLVLAGENDDLAPPASVLPGYTKSRAVDKLYKAFPLGHIDMLVGRDAPTSVWPEITEWIGARAR